MNSTAFNTRHAQEQQLLLFTFTFTLLLWNVNRVSATPLGALAQRLLSPSQSSFGALTARLAALLVVLLCGVLLRGVVQLRLTATCPCWPLHALLFTSLRALCRSLSGWSPAILQHHRFVAVSAQSPIVSFIRTDFIPPLL